MSEFICGSIFILTVIIVAILGSYSLGARSVLGDCKNSGGSVVKSQIIRCEVIDAKEFIIE